MEIKSPFTSLPLTVRGYTLTSEISSGAFACIYMAHHKKFNSSSTQIVAKVIPLNEVETLRKMTFIAEVSSLCRLDHNNIIRLYDFFEDYNCLFLILEYCSGGTLESKIPNRVGLPPDICINLCTNILNAMEYIHNSNCAHYDIKPSNFLFDQYGRIKVADFGLSIQSDFGSLSDHFFGSMMYMAPEVLCKEKHDPFAADIWSLGILFFNMATGCLPWPRDTLSNLIKAAKSGVLPSVPWRAPELKPIVMKMVVVKPTERISIEELLKNPLFCGENSLSSTHFPLISNAFSHANHSASAGSLTFIGKNKIMSQIYRSLSRDRFLIK